jgi:hypothetical protein
MGLPPQQSVQPLVEQYISFDHPRIQRHLERRPDLREKLESKIVDLPMRPVLPLEEQLRQRENLYLPEWLKDKMDDAIEALMQLQGHSLESRVRPPITR